MSWAAPVGAGLFRNSDLSAGCRYMPEASTLFHISRSFAHSQFWTTLRMHWRIGPGMRSGGFTPWNS